MLFIPVISRAQDARDPVSGLQCQHMGFLHRAGLLFSVFDVSLQMQDTCINILHFCLMQIPRSDNPSTYKDLATQMDLP